MSHIEFSRRARQDLERLSTTDRRRVRAALEALARGEPHDTHPVLGCSPWCCLRIGESGLLHRPLAAEELAAVGHAGGDGWLVGRVVVGISPKTP